MRFYFRIRIQPLFSEREAKTKRILKNQKLMAQTNRLRLKLMSSINKICKPIRMSLHWPEMGQLEYQKG